MTNPKNTIKKTTPKGKRKALQLPKQVRDDPAVHQYWLALTDPFHPDAVGARVPDMYAAHTATYTIRATHTVTANAGGAASVFVFPNVVTAAFLAQGNSADFVSTVWGDNTTLTQSRWGISDTSLGAKLDNYRIVGLGLRVTNMSSMTNSSGKFIMGTYPVSSTWHTKDFAVGGATLPTNAGMTQGATTSEWGIPQTASGGGQIAPNLLVQYPGAQVRSALEMGEVAFDVIPRPVDPRAFQFRNPNGQFTGWESAGSLAAGATTTGNADFLDLNGFEASFVSLQGAVGSTSSFDLELVYHIEGRPYLAGISTTTSQGELVTPSASNASPVNPMGFFEAVACAVKLPAVRTAIEAGATLMHPILGQFARSL